MLDASIAVATLCVVPGLMIHASISDILSMTIANRVSGLLAGIFPVLALGVGLPPADIGLHVALGAGCLVLGFAMFAAGWMGGGDAKLMAATTVWFGPSALLVQYFLVTAVYGGVLTLALLAARRFAAPVTGIGFVDRLLHPETGIPYGVALGAAGLTVYADSPWMGAARAALGRLS